MEKIRNVYGSSLSFVYLICAYAITRLNCSKNNQGPCLIGSGYGEHLDDNARVLSEFLSNARVPHYLIQKEKCKSKSRSNSLRHGSFRSYVHFFRCQGAFYSHSISDILPFVHYIPWLFNCLRRPPLVFIQHGVIGLKVSPNFKRYLKRLDRVFDYVVATTPCEVNVLQDLGIESSKIRLAGLPRFDLLKKRPYSQEKLILLFLTWGDKNAYLEKRATARISIEKAISKTDKINLAVVNHPMMGEPTDARVDNSTIFDIILRSSLLITDNSSIAWDFWYKGDDVLFFQPDYNYHASCEQLLANNVAFDTEQLEQLIAAWINKGFVLPDIRWAHHDSSNSERVYGLIKESR